MEILRQEMLADEENFGLENTVEEIDPGTPIELDQIAEQVEDLDLEEVVMTSKKNKKKTKKKAAPRWGYDEEDVPENLDDMDALAAALEEERMRRRRKGGKPIVDPTPINSTEPIAESVLETEAVPVEKESAKTKREKRKEKKKLKEESELTEVTR